MKYNVVYLDGPENNQELCLKLQDNPDKVIPIKNGIAGGFLVESVIDDTDFCTINVPVRVGIIVKDKKTEGFNFDYLTDSEAIEKGYDFVSDDKMELAVKK